MQTCRARLKLAAHSISFYNPKGDNVDMMQFIDDVKNFDPDAIDDDLSSLPQVTPNEKKDSNSPGSPATSGSKRQRT